VRRGRCKLPGMRPRPADPASLLTPFAPMLATLSEPPPDDEGYRCEVKYDGYRVPCAVSSGPSW
jgi:ATP-dependent DNA ligase